MQRERLDISAPQPLTAAHQLGLFNCGNPLLNDWLQKRALHNHLVGASRCFVVCNAQAAVVGYYAMAAGAIHPAEATGAVRRNMPSPVPVMVLARLAVCKSAQGTGLGAALLKDAVVRSTTVATQVGVRALLVQAIDDTAKAFYEKYGFSASPIAERTLMLKLPTQN